MTMRRLCVALAILAGLFVGAATPALADTNVGMCGWQVGAACVNATTGSKNYSNRTQWVGWVTASDPGTAGVTKLEAWGDGFYFSTPVNPNTVGPQQTWGAQRWVRSGSGVCGAATYTNGNRSVACISITV